jgi:hypothetical protein
MVCYYIIQMMYSTSKQRTTICVKWKQKKEWHHITKFPEKYDLMSNIQPFIKLFINLTNEQYIYVLYIKNNKQPW